MERERVAQLEAAGWADIGPLSHLCWVLQGLHSTVSVFS